MLSGRADLKYLSIPPPRKSVGRVDLKDLRIPPPRMSSGGADLKVLSIPPPRMSSGGEFPFDAEQIVKKEIPRRKVPTWTR